MKKRWRLKFVLQKLSFAIALMSCIFYQERQSELDAITYISHIPIVDLNGGIFDFRDSIKIYKYGDKMMYEFQFATDTIDENGKVAKGFLRKRFVHRQSDSLGNLYVLGEETTFRNLSVDSFLMLRGFKNSNWSLILNFPLYRSDFDRSKGVLKDTYAPPKDESGNIGDTAYLYYTNNLHTNAYSLSSTLDSIKRMRLFKIELIYNPGHNRTYNKSIPRRVLRFEIQKGSNFNKQEILNYFKKFENDRLVSK